MRAQSRAHEALFESGANWVALALRSAEPSRLVRPDGCLSANAPLLSTIALYMYIHCVARLNSILLEEHMSAHFLALARMHETVRQPSTSRSVIPNSTSLFAF